MPASRAITPHSGPSPKVGKSAVILNFQKSPVRIIADHVGYTLRVALDDQTLGSLDRWIDSAPQASPEACQALLSNIVSHTERWRWVVASENPQAPILEIKIARLSADSVFNQAGRSPAPTDLAFVAAVVAAARQTSGHATISAQIRPIVTECRTTIPNARFVRWPYYVARMDASLGGQWMMCRQQGAKSDEYGFQPEFYRDEDSAVAAAIQKASTGMSPAEIRHSRIDFIIQTGLGLLVGAAAVAALGHFFFG